MTQLNSLTTLPDQSLQSKKKSQLKNKRKNSKRPQHQLSKKSRPKLLKMAEFLLAQLLKPWLDKRKSTFPTLEKDLVLMAELLSKMFRAINPLRRLCKNKRLNKQKQRLLKRRHQPRPLNQKPKSSKSQKTPTNRSN